ncbi:MAG: AMP-binding protein [Bryobacteraceae bacterium]
MNLGRMLREAAAKNPQKPAVVCLDNVITYDALNRSTETLARWLLREGLEPGDRVAIHWSNSIETVQLYFACFKAGLIAVPVNNRLKPPEIEYILNHSRAKLCFSQPQLAPFSQEIAHNCEDLRRIHTELPTVQESAIAHIPLPEVSPEKVTAILYTSGTTARPKGVMHTHVSLTGSTELMYSIGVDESHTVMAVTQMVHIAGLACVLLPGIRNAATVVVLPIFEPTLALDMIEKWGVSYTLTLPAVLRFMVEEQARKPRKVDSMRLCFCGGDSVPVEMQERYHALFGHQVRELFGMTETVPVTCIREGEQRPGSMGPALDLIDARVADVAGNVLPDETKGEFQVQSPANCIGYWDDSQATWNAFDHGWLRTGDRVRRDKDAFYWFEGRVKQIIVRGGSNISPQEVEEPIYHHPAVLEVGVIGLPDPAYGEKVVAFVALREGMNVTEEGLRDFVKARVADYKVPERIIFLPALPKGLTGKVQRRDLKDLVARSPEWGLAANA